MARALPDRLLVRNVAALVLAYAIPRAFTFASAVVAARVLGAATFGAYASAGAIAVVASIVATLGMQPLLVREMARAPERAPRLLAAANTVKLGTVTLMAIALPVAAAGVLRYPPEVVAAAALLGASYAIGAFVENLAAWFQAVERMHVWTQASALSGFVAGALGIAVTLLTRRLLWLCAAPVVGQGLALAFLLARAPASARRLRLAPRHDVRRLLGMLAPFALAFVGTTIYYRADLLLLSRLRPVAEVGIYGAGSRFLDIAQALALACAGALLPRMSRRSHATRSHADRPGAGAAAATGAATALELALLGAVPAAGALLLLRGPVVALLYGHAYGPAAAVLALLAPALAPLVVNMFALTALVAADAMHVAARAFFGAAAVKIALALTLIPELGAVGAAGATLLAETALSVALVAALVRRGAAPGRRALQGAAAAAALAALLALAAVFDPLVAAAGYTGGVLALYAGLGLLRLPARAGGPAPVREAA